MFKLSLRNRTENVLEHQVSLKDFKRIKLGEKEYSKMHLARSIELEQGLKLRDPTLDALNLINPAYLRDISSN